MSMTFDSEIGKGHSVIELGEQLHEYINQAAREGLPLHEVEPHLHELTLRIAQSAMGTLLSLQGDGNLGEVIETEDGVRLYRSAEPVTRPLQTVFGKFDIQAYAYARGVKKKIELRPVDARLELPEGPASYLFEEFAQYFCVNEAFSASADVIERVLRQKVSVDTLERINRRVGGQAEEYLDRLAAPPVEDEEELLVITGDGKGVPLVKEDARRIPIFDPEERRGNRRMAILAGVYTVAPFVRTSEEILAALFRDDRERSRRKRQRPPCQGKQLVARFARERDLGEGPQSVSGAVEAFSWAAARAADRHREGQPVIALMDGQPSLWETLPDCLDPDIADNMVEILDIIHVAQYVWRAAKVFHQQREHQEAFARERLDRILQGQVQSVITGFKRMASLRRLTGKHRREIDTVCGYFERHASRMKYDEYLAQGYPIATGVIEGACRHLVKDRMERSGMRWTLDGAQQMLSVRAAHHSTYRSDFYTTRIEAEQEQLHPHKALVSASSTSI